MSVFAFVFLLVNSDPFIAEATASSSYDVQIPREALKRFVDDVGLFQRHMPGVIGVRQIESNRYLYSTQKELPLAGSLQTDFDIGKTVTGDSLFVYESVDPDAENYMQTRVLIRPRDETNTTIEIDLRVRLRRESGGDVHWLAPLLGEAFISKQMTNDLQDMLSTFIESSNRELYQRLAVRDQPAG